jgi:hypothetical protein
MTLKSLLVELGQSLQNNGAKLRFVPKLAGGEVATDLV